MADIKQIAAQGMTAQTGDFSLDADAIEKAIIDNAPKEKQNDIKRVVLAGMKVLFSKETHNQVFDSINQEDQIPLEDELGAGAADMMMALYGESKQTMPLEAVIPAGVILLAHACKFINDTKLAPITDETFTEAVQMFIPVIHEKFDPDFRNKIGGKSKDGQPAPPAQPPGGLISQGA